MTTFSSISINKFEEQHTDIVVDFWRASMEKAIGIPSLHSFESQAYFLREILPKSNKVYVVSDDRNGDLIGFMATDGNTIDQLYIHIEHQNKGVGYKLIQLAKEESTGTLQLRTFEVNKNAQRFYEKQGFKASDGDCNNEEGLQDIVYTWQTI
jgi:GNAT superfamily N-acetyltransferase